MPCVRLWLLFVLVARAWKVGRAGNGALAGALAGALDGFDPSQAVLRGTFLYAIFYEAWVDSVGGGVRQFALSTNSKSVDGVTATVTHPVHVNRAWSKTLRSPKTSVPRPSPRPLCTHHATDRYQVVHARSMNRKWHKQSANNRAGGARLLSHRSQKQLQQ